MRPESGKPREGRIPVRGDVLRAAREKKDWGYQELSDQTERRVKGKLKKISITTIKKAERGGPSYRSTIRWLAEVLDLQPSDLWDLHGEPVGGADLAENTPVIQPPSPRDPVPDEPALSPFPVQVNPAPERLSRERPEIHVTLTRFEQGRVQAGYFEPLRRDLQDEFHWPETDAARAVIVLRELVDNAFVHGCRGIGDLPVSFSVEASQGGRTLTLIVNSPGPGFDFEQVSARGPDRDLFNEDEDTAKGFYLVRRYAKELVGTADGRKIMAVMVRSHIELEPIRDDGLMSLLEVNGHLIAVVTLPESISRYCFEFDRDRFDRFLESATAAITGGIIDATKTVDFDSDSVGIFISIRKRFQSRGIKFCMLLSSDLDDTFRTNRYLPPYVPANIDEAIEYLLDEMKA
jgi:anti-sigma regulatory factor (Ser/Thr protein kinase)